MPSEPTVSEKVRAFIAKDIFKGQDASDLTDTTPLITGGIMDSISTIQLVDFLEKEYGIEFKPHEVDQDNLNTIEMIAAFVERKMNPK